MEGVFLCLMSSTVLVHEIKANGQETHDGRHFAELVTSEDASLRSRVARPVAQVFGYAESTGCDTCELLA